MIDIIITSYKEPKATLRAVNAFLKQKTEEELRIIVVDPFPQTEKFLKNKIKDKRFKFILDPGEGKGYALNILFQEFGSQNKRDIFILTDGDVYVSDNTVSEILDSFKDEKIGCITGKPFPVEDRNTKYGFWAHFLFSGVHRARKKISKKKKFMECSGYLMALRKGIIFDFPTNTSEDAIIPYLVWKKGYNIAYVDKAKAYVKNPSNWKDWVNQKVRNIKAHENLNEIAPDLPRTKSFFNEVKEGWFFIFTFPKSLKEFWWTIQLYFARLYIYFKAFIEIRKKSSYQDGWRETEINSTKPLD